jgi:hypothetical protein
VVVDRTLAGTLGLCRLVPASSVATGEHHHREGQMPKYLGLEYSVSESGCWVAGASVWRNNRGRPFTRGEAAARFICQQVKGSPPEPRYHAAHKCHNGQCLNPDHIEWQTPEENSAASRKNVEAKRCAS